MDNQKCKLSEFGLQQLSRSKKKNSYGVIVGETYDSCYKVIWDGAKSPITYHKDFIEVLAASPSTASNEDKKEYTDKELTEFCSELSLNSIASLIAEKEFCDCIHTEAANFYEADDRMYCSKCKRPLAEPKAVQQAAKEWAKQNAEFVPDRQSEQMIEFAFLAGASFKDEAKESDQDKYWSQAISMIEVAETNGEDYLIKYKELHEKLKSKFTISCKQNSIQQAHDKSTYE